MQMTINDWKLVIVSCPLYGALLAADRRIDKWFPDLIIMINSSWSMAILSLTFKVIKFESNTAWKNTCKLLCFFNPFGVRI